MVKRAWQVVLGILFLGLPLTELVFWDAISSSISISYESPLAIPLFIALVVLPWILATIGIVLLTLFMIPFLARTHARIAPVPAIDQSPRSVQMKKRGVALIATGVVPPVLLLGLLVTTNSPGAGFAIVFLGFPLLIICFPFFVFGIFQFIKGFVVESGEQSIQESSTPGAGV